MMQSPWNPKLIVLVSRMMKLDTFVEKHTTLHISHNWVLTFGWDLILPALAPQRTSTLGRRTRIYPFSTSTPINMNKALSSLSSHFFPSTHEIRVNTKFCLHLPAADATGSCSGAE